MCSRKFSTRTGLKEKAREKWNINHTSNLTMQRNFAPLIKSLLLYCFLEEFIWLCLIYIYYYLVWLFINPRVRCNRRKITVSPSFHRIIQRANTQFKNINATCPWLPRTSKICTFLSLRNYLLLSCARQSVRRRLRRCFLSTPTTQEFDLAYTAFRVNLTVHIHALLHAGAILIPT